MKKRHLSILIFGVSLAILAVVLNFFEYRYFVGSMDTEIYTSVVAFIFTAVGVWIGINVLKKKKTNVSAQPVEQKIDQKKIEELNLNEREYQVLELIAEGLTNQEIADRLFLAVPTIKTHISNLYSKLDVTNRSKAVHKARSLNLI